MREASVLVSRFSTLMFEALLMGRKVIYYDPFHEGFECFEDYPLRTTSPGRMEKLLASDVSIDGYMDEYVHRGGVPSAELCARALDELHRSPSRGALHSAWRRARWLVHAGWWKGRRLLLKPLVRDARSDSDQG